MDRRSFLAAGVTLAAAATLRAEPPDTSDLLIGTYTGKTSKGIYRSRLNLETGELAPPELAAEVTSPSFLALDPSRRYVYAVSEISDFNGKNVGGVTAFAWDGNARTLTKLNAQSSEGAGPCHLSVDPSGRAVVVANYGGGSVAVLPIGEGGRLKPATAFVQHTGKSVNPQRQGEPHTHSAYVDASGKWTVAADLGLDRVFVYAIDAVAGTLRPNDPPYASVEPGGGPRHFAFHPDGKRAFVINELTSTLTMFDWDADAGKLTPVQTLSTLPDGKPVPGNSTAEVVVHPFGKSVYGSNRGHDSIAVFTLEGGKLTLVQNAQGKFKVPRNFAVDPTGAFLLACGQENDVIESFRIDPKAGTLTSMGNTIAVGSPVCVRILPAGR